MPITNPALLLAALAATALPALSQAQQSVTRDLTSFRHAAENCQPAREYPDLRVRQMEIDNIGTTNAYVVCGLTPPHMWSAKIKTVTVVIYNDTYSTATVVCNLQDNAYLNGATTTYKQQVVLHAKIAHGFTFAEPVEGQDHQNGLSLAAVQCILPPGTSIQGTEITYQDTFIVP